MTAMKLSYEIRRSAGRRKLTITVERDCRVIIHAPLTTSETKIQEIVEKKRLWIYEKLNHSQKYRHLPHPPGKELVSGESALYLGRQYRIEVVDSGLSEIRFFQRFFIPASRARNRKRVLQEWYIRKARERILPRVRLLARQLGVSYNRARIVNNRYRWGSCTVKDNININWKLIKAPMFVVDYIIVHELAHLLEGNHTPRFWNILRTHVPHMEKAREWLKRHGQLLDEDI